MLNEQIECNSGAIWSHLVYSTNISEIMYTQNNTSFNNNWTLLRHTVALSIAHNGHNIL